MANTIRIKRRTTGNVGAPASLANAELAFNEVDNVLYYGKGTGGAGGTATTVDAIGGAGAFATLAGSAQTISGDKTFTGTVAFGANTTGVTATGTDNSTKLATTAFVKGQGYLTANQSITISGDASGTGTTAITLTLANSGVTAGTYKSVTVDAKGRVTAGSNPTTLSGYGITDAQPLDADLTAIAALAGTSGLLKKTAADTWSLDTSTYLTANQSITLSGDASGSGTTAITVTLASVGIAGTYTKVTTDAKGRVTAGTTLAATDIPTLTAAKISDFDTQVRTSRLDQMAAPTASVSLNNQKITALATPTQDSDAATKAYVDAARMGMDFKDSVRVATTANITLSGTQTIDGVSVIAGDRVLVKDQATGSQNGIYVVAAGAWSRATDADTSAEVTAGMFTFVAEGTTNADTGWVLSTNDTITLDTTALTFVQFSGAGQITAGAGLTKTGSTLDVVTASSARIVVNADSIDLATTGVGAGTYKSVTVDTYGRVTAGSNPTTLSGYGITDAQPLDADLTAIAGLAGTSGFLKKTAADTWTLDTSTYLTANQSITISGDASGTGTTAITLTLANTGVGAGTYKSVTVNAKGLVTAGSNPTTLAGYGITDAQPLDATLTALAGVTTAANSLIYATAADTFSTTTLSAFGRTLIDDADAATARGTLGLDTMSTQAASNVAITGGSIDNITFDGGTF